MANPEDTFKTGLGQIRELFDPNREIITPNKLEGNKAVTHLIAERVAAGSGLGPQRSKELFKTVVQFMDKHVNQMANPLGSEAYESFMASLKTFAAEDLFMEETAKWSGQGTSRLHTKLTDLGTFSLKGLKLKDAVTWKQFAGRDLHKGYQDEAFKPLLKDISRTFESAKTKGSNRLRYQVASLAQSQFSVMGQGASSRHVAVRLGIGDKFSLALNFFDPDPSGMMAEYSESGARQIVKGQQIRGLYKSYITDATLDGDVWKRGQMVSPFKAQMNYFGQLVGELENRAAIGSLTEQDVSELGKKMKTFQSQMGFEIGPALPSNAAVNAHKGVMTAFGERLRGGVKTLFGFNESKYRQQGFSPAQHIMQLYQNSADPSDTRKLFPIGSPSSAAKMYATIESSLARDPFEMGSEIPFHKEVRKSIKDLEPHAIQGQNQTIGKTGLKRFVETNVDKQPVMFHRSLVTFHGHEKEIGKDIKFEDAYGEGSMPIKRSAYQSGGMDFTDIKTYKIAPSKFEGGRSLIRADENFITALSNWREGRRMPLPKNVIMGLNPSDQSIVTSSGKAAETEHIIGLAREKGDSLNVITERNVSRVKDTPQASRLISPFGFAKSTATTTADDVFETILKGLGTESKDIEMMISSKDLPDHFFSKAKDEAGQLLHRDFTGGAARQKYLSGAAAIASAAQAAQGATPELQKRLLDYANRPVPSLVQDVLKAHGSETIAKTDFSVLMAQQFQKEFGKDLGEEGTLKAITNIMGTHTEFGKEHMSLGWEEFAKTKQGGVFTQKQMTDFLGLTQEQTNRVLASKTPMQAILDFRIPSYGSETGQGTKASIEPRMVYGAQASGLGDVMDSILKRTGKFMDPIKAVYSSMLIASGKPAKLPLDYETATFDFISKNPEKWGQGNKGMLVTMPDWFTDLARKKDLPEQIYIPGLQETKLIGVAETGVGRYKAKELREVYNNFIREVALIESIDQSKNPADAARKASHKFQQGLLNHMVELHEGVAGGGAAGNMRGAVAGGLYLPNVAMGDFLMEVGKDGELVERDIVSRFKKAGGDMGNAAVLSQAAVEHMYGDAIENAQKSGSKELEQIYTAQRDALRRGDFEFSVPKLGIEKQLITGAEWRQPVMSLHSMAGVNILPDMSSPGTRTEAYVRMMESSAGMETKVLDTTGKQMFNKSGDMKDKVMRALNYDFDGDDLNVAAVGEAKARKALADQMKSKTTTMHAMRYHGMKDAIVNNLANFQSTMSHTERQAAAGMSPKLVTPQVSNAFTELKWAVKNSQLDDMAKGDLFRLFDVAEQVGISGKRLEGAPEVGILTAMKASEINQSLRGGSAAEAQKSVNSMFDFLLGDSAGEIQVSKGAEQANIQVAQMKSNINSVIQNYFGQGKAHKSFFQSIVAKHSDGKSRIPEYILNDIQYLEETIVKGHTGTQIEKDLSRLLSQVKPTASSASRASVSGIAESIQRGGAAAAERLPTKGILGVAAAASLALVAASITGVVMGPSFSGGSGGSNRTIHDFSAFSDQMNPFLQKGGVIPEVPKTYLAPGRAETMIHVPTGHYSRESMQGMMGAVNAMYPGGNNRMEIVDGRAHLDKHLLSRIKDEII